MSAYLRDGRVEIDNNLVENEIRPSAVGKKNYLFFGSGEAGKHSAILYTIVISARRRGLDPEAYLADVIHRLPTTPATEMHTLTQAAWAACANASQARCLRRPWSPPRQQKPRPPAQPPDFWPKALGVTLTIIQRMVAQCSASASVNKSPPMLARIVLQP